MWQFIKGVEDPSQKKRKSTEDELNYFKDYDKKEKCNTTLIGKNSMIGYGQYGCLETKHKFK